MRRHAIALLGFAAITGVWLRPLLSRLSTALPGTSAGDNVTFVWNIWWMRYVVHHPDASFFWTPFLLHPFGADLTLHTHTALPALLAALAGPPSILASQNILIVAHLYLNFVCSYALGYRATGAAVPAVIAAVVFGTSSFVGAHLLGHFNLIGAWIIPLVVVAAWRAADTKSIPSGVAAGAAVGAAAYIDYYLFIYAVILLVLLAAGRSLTLSFRGRGPSRVSRRLMRMLVGLLVLDAGVIAAIAIWPGDRIDIGPLHMSIRSISNPLTAGWIVLCATCVVALRSRIHIAYRGTPPWSAAAVPIAGAVTATLLLLPLVVRAARLWLEGRYVSQSYQWRSGPGGIDTATLLLGNPFHALWGAQVQSVYRTLHIDVVEGSGWMPAAALILAAIAVAARRRGPHLQAWSVAGVLFMMWALGPWLTGFGRQTPLILPAMILRFVPIVANARIPGRAMVVVYLCIAMLAAIGLARLLHGTRRHQVAGWLLTALLAVECAPASPPLYTPTIAAEYELLNTARRPGAVCELPMGVRDGFGEIGSFDSAVLLHQAVHGRPIVGGFVARLPPTIIREYDTIPVVGTLLRLSSGGRLADQPVVSPAGGAAALTAAGIAFIVLDTRTASPDLVRYVESAIRLRLLAERDGVMFYEVM
jgi:hypothetical protein